VMGKDILKFHAVIWPALLLAAGYELPRHLFIHGYLLMDEHKMSKSLGNVLDPFTIMERFGTDALRFYCFREVSFGLDGNVSPASFEERYTTELANEYGNLASRTLNMLGRYAGGRVPDAPLDPELSADFDGLSGEVCSLLDDAEITQALERIWRRVRRLNRYVEEQAPWKLAKDAGQADRLAGVLASLAEGLRVVTVLLAPYMPSATQRLLAALGAAGTTWEYGARSFDGPVGELPPLFPRPQ
jgi:methionyl-tRNA synthetase